MRDGCGTGKGQIEFSSQRIELFLHQDSRGGTIRSAGHLILYCIISWTRLSNWPPAGEGGGGGVGGRRRRKSNDRGAVKFHYNQISRNEKISTIISYSAAAAASVAGLEQEKSGQTWKLLVFVVVPR